MPTRIHTVCTHKHKAALSHLRELARGQRHTNARGSILLGCGAAGTACRCQRARSTGNRRRPPCAARKGCTGCRTRQTPSETWPPWLLRANDEAGCCRVVSAGLAIRTSKIWNRDVTRAAFPRRKSSQTAWACLDYSSLRCPCCYCVRRCLYCGAVVCFVLLRTLLCSVACSVGWCHRSTRTRLEAALVEH